MPRVELMVASRKNQSSALHSHQQITVNRRNIITRCKLEGNNIKKGVNTRGGIMVLLQK
jgi:hypothetical protein